MILRDLYQSFYRPLSLPNTPRERKEKRREEAGGEATDRRSEEITTAESEELFSPPAGRREAGEMCPAALLML